MRLPIQPFARPCTPLQDATVHCTFSQCSTLTSSHMHHAVFHLATSAQDLSANLFQQRLKVFVSFFSTLKALKSLRVLMHSTPRATANANIGMPISSAMKASNQANNHRLPLTSPHHACPPCPPAGHCNTSGSPAPFPPPCSPCQHSSAYECPHHPSCLHASLRECLFPPYVVWHSPSMDPPPPPITRHLPPHLVNVAMSLHPPRPPLRASSKLNRNCLMGVLPTMGAAVKAPNVASNFLSSSFPTAAVTACDSRSNCFADASKCANSNDMAQRATADCNICGSTGAAGALCGGGYCTPNATTPAVAGTPNTEGQAVVALFCQGGPIEPSMRGAMLNLKASLGVTLTDWVGTAPCKIAGQSTVVGARSNVECNATGKVTSIDLSSQQLKGSMHTDITKLTTLSSL
ncbi:unnamed protein product [Closterium sp. NIES-64]|nr:unnamed protein product [Closterium sp. NIES-64]